jgi:hypothetical protein
LSRISREIKSKCSSRQIYSSRDIQADTASLVSPVTRASRYLWLVCFLFNTRSMLTILLTRRLLHFVFHLRLCQIQKILHEKEASSDALKYRHGDRSLGLQAPDGKGYLPFQIYIEPSYIPSDLSLSIKFGSIPVSSRHAYAHCCSRKTLSPARIRWIVRPIISGVTKAGISIALL